MPDNRRSRRSNKSNDMKRPVILAKRDVDPSKSSEPQTSKQPKILLKSKDKEQTLHGPAMSTTATNFGASQSQPQSISSSSKGCPVEPQSHSQSPNITVQKETQDTTIIKTVPVMTKQATVMTSSFHVNSSAHDFLIENNTDFLVVGVIGSQGVGKSTVMSLLANDSIDYDIYNTLIKNQEGMFPIKIKTTKGVPSSPSSPRTESMHMFITNDRMILLDTSPILCNAHIKDATTSEIDDIQNIIILLSVCHLIIVVQDDYFNLNLMRLLRLAELAKPNNEKIKYLNKSPNILFVKNKAKRTDFLPKEIAKYETMLKYVFKDSQLKIFFGQTDEPKSNNTSQYQRRVNYFLFPELKGDVSMPFYPNMNEMVEDLRNRVFVVKKTDKICNTSIEITEHNWFELFCDIANCRNQFFLSSYEDIRRYHTNDTLNHAEKKM